MSGAAKNLLDPGERSARGLAVEGQATAAAARTPATLLEESWRDFIFAEVWSRPGLEPRARYLIAIAAATCCNAEDERIEGYVRGALANEALTLAELREATLHLAVYGGWGNGGRLDRAITRVAEELGLPPASVAPIRAEPWDPEERTARGQAEFRAVMEFPPGPPTTPLLESIADFVFGEVWCRDGLDQRARRWISLVGVCLAGAEIPIGSHIHAAMTSGNCTSAEMLEFVLVYATHAGWPRASLVQGIVLAMTQKVEAGLPWNG